MASVGQLAAGIAHEINNPIGYINSNLGSLQQYLQDLLTIVAAYQKLEARLPVDEEIRGLQKLRQDLDLDFLKEDSLALLSESCEGVQRVRNIVQDLKDFSHVDSAEWQMVDLHKGLDSTLNIAHNEIKYKAEIVREYGDVPLVECLPSQLNQVFMNMFINAAHAIEEKGKITIRTGREDTSAWIEIADTGKGIAPEHLSRIFDPFFTTKPVGKGTGLGLSLSYSIIQKHQGRIAVDSCPGKGTTFRIVIPLKRVSETAPQGGLEDAEST
jgi:signal transduction histidine kinase